MPTEKISGKQEIIRDNKLFQQLTQKGTIRTIAGFAISAFLLWLTLYQSKLQINQLLLQGTNWIYFSLAIITFIISVYGYSRRANLIWISRGKYPDTATLESIVTGNFYNCLLPGNMGDVIRAWHYGRKSGQTFGRSFAAVITEKWIDAQMFAVLAVVLFLLKPFVPHYILYAIYTTAAVATLLATLYFLFSKYRSLERLAWLPVLHLKKTGRFLYQLYTHVGKHISNLRANRLLLRYTLYCAGVMCLNITQFYLLLKAAGVAEPVCSWYTAFLASLSMMIIAFIPSAPGNIGVLHYGIYSALILASQQYGINPDSASLQSFALTGIYIHLSYLIPDVLLGVVVVVKDRKIIF